MYKVRYKFCGQVRELEFNRKEYAQSVYEGLLESVRIGNWFAEVEFVVTTRSEILN